MLSSFKLGQDYRELPSRRHFPNSLWVSADIHVTTIAAWVKQWWLIADLGTPLAQVSFFPISQLQKPLAPCCHGATFPISSSFIGDDFLSSGVYEAQASFLSLDEFGLKDWDVNTLV